MVRRSVSAIRTLPPDVQEAVKEAYALSIRAALLLGAAGAGLALASSGWILGGGMRSGKIEAVEGEQPSVTV
jgi:hypothetical protein